MGFLDYYSNVGNSKNGGVILKGLKVLMFLFLVILFVNVCSALDDVLVAGYAVSDKSTGIGLGTGYSVVIAGKALNTTGTVKKVNMWVEALNDNPSTLTFGCYNGTPTTFTKRAESTIITTITAIGNKNHTVNIIGCKVGDFIGYYQNGGDVRPSVNGVGDQNLYYKLAACSPTCVTMSLSAGYKEPSIQYWMNATDHENFINLSSPSILNNSQYDRNTLKFNLTANSSIDFNCTLFVNDSNYNTSLFGAGVDVLVNFSYTFPDGHYYYNISCETTGGLDSEGTEERIFFVDTVRPFIYWYTPASTNKTIITGYLNTSINVVDTNLYSFHYNITYQNGTIFNSTINTSLTGETNKTIDPLINYTGVGGVFNSLVWVCDGHTAKESPPFEVIKKPNGLEFNGIEIISKDPAKDVTYKKLIDRYIFGFEYTTPTNKIEIQMPQECIYLDNTGYKGHFVCNNKYWVDFEGKYYISVKDNLVTITSITPLTKWNFNSIGVLNCNTETTTFFVYETTEGHTLHKLSGDSTTYYFNITYNSSFMTSVSANLLFNGTSYVMSGSIIDDKYTFNRDITIPPYTTDVNLDIIFEYTINSVQANTTSYVDYIYAPKIDNCTNYNLTFINFTVLDELNNSLLIADYKYLFNVVNGAYSFNYNGSMDNKNNVSFCLYPNWTSFTTDITLQYSVDGYDTRDYVTSNFNVDNVTDYINLYILQTGVASEITVHTVDDLDNDLSNVFIEAYRWDIPSDTDKLVETEYTDNDGNAIFNLKTGSEYYSFKFYQAGVLVLSTTRFKIFSTLLEYIISDSETSIIEEYLNIKTIVGSVSYDNSTKVITYEWVDYDKAADKYCLNVTDHNHTYSNQCLTTSIGSMTYTLTDFNVSYIAQGLAKYVNTTHFYLVDEESINSVLGMDTLGKGDSLIIAFVLFVFFATLGIVSKNLILILSGVGVVALYFFGFTPLGFGAVLGAISIIMLLLIIINKRSE